MMTPTIPQELPSKAFSGMSSLEVLNLEQAQLVELSQHLEPLVQRLRLFKATGNPLRCDCKLRWLWNHLQKEDHHQSRLDLPKCATPFSVKSRDVNSLSGRQHLAMSTRSTITKWFKMSFE